MYRHSCSDSVPCFRSSAQVGQDGERDVLSWDEAPDRKAWYYLIQQRNLFHFLGNTWSATE